jgi:hypothetical protein
MLLLLLALLALALLAALAPESDAAGDRTATEPVENWGLSRIIGKGINPAPMESIAGPKKG